MACFCARQTRAPTFNTWCRPGRLYIRIADDVSEVTPRILNDIKDEIAVQMGIQSKDLICTIRSGSVSTAYCSSFGRLVGGCGCALFRRLVAPALPGRCGYLVARLLMSVCHCSFAGSGGSDCQSGVLLSCPALSSARGLLGFYSTTCFRTGAGLCFTNSLARAVCAVAPSGLSFSFDHGAGRARRAHPEP